MRDRPVVSAPTDETAPILGWLRVDGRDFALEEDEAWKLAS